MENDNTQIRFEILGITIPKERDLFWDLGYVKSIPEGLKKIDMLTDRSPGKYKSSIYKNHQGMAIQIPGFNGPSRNFIFYKKQLSKAKDIEFRAHEETHIIDYIKKLPLLEQRLLENQKVKIDFKNVEDEEVRAQIGAIYALQQRGINPNRIFFPSNDSFNHALKIYNQSKVPEKKIYVM